MNMLEQVIFLLEGEYDTGMTSVKDGLSITRCSIAAYGCFVEVLAGVLVGSLPITAPSPATTAAMRHRQQKRQSSRPALRQLLQPGVSLTMR